MGTGTHDNLDSFYNFILNHCSMYMVYTQALQYWIPSLEDSQVYIVFSGSRESVEALSSHKVIITSYDLAVKMNDSLKSCNFNVVIAVGYVCQFPWNSEGYSGLCV